MNEVEISREKVMDNAVYDSGLGKRFGEWSFVKVSER